MNEINTNKTMRAEVRRLKNKLEDEEFDLDAFLEDKETDSSVTVSPDKKYLGTTIDINYSDNVEIRISTERNSIRGIFVEKNEDFPFRETKKYYVKYEPSRKIKEWHERHKIIEISL